MSRYTGRKRQMRTVARLILALMLVAALVGAVALLKIARIQGNRATGDCFVDLAGYSACGGELEGV